MIKNHSDDKKLDTDNDPFDAVSTHLFGGNTISLMQLQTIPEDVH